MTERSPAAQSDVEELLKRLEQAHQSLIDVLKGADAEQYADPHDGESLKTITERTSDDVNFYYGRLAARALSLPQPPCIQRADFGSLREAVAALRVAHRRFANLLHDLTVSDLERRAADPELGSYTMRQILEMAAAHYALRMQQVAQMKPGSSRAGA